MYRISLDNTDAHMPVMHCQDCLPSLLTVIGLCNSTGTRSARASA